MKSVRRALLASLVLAMAACAPRPAVIPSPPAAPPATAPATTWTDYSQHPDYPALRARLVEQGFDAAALDALFAKVGRDQRVLDAMGRPAEAKPWYQYRRIFVTDERVRLGVRFWDEHAAEVAAAAEANGVDPEFIVAIIGVETKYGAIMGKFPVISSLATLAFEWPSRATFFRSELEQYLVLCREMGLDPLVPVGSYAGAMGAGQFMPSSYRAYARDGDGDGRIDLWGDFADVTASVANYFAVHGWRRGEPVAVPAVLREGAEEPARATALTRSTVGELRAAFTFSAGVDDGQQALYVALDTEDGRVHQIGLGNFWVITRYNRSPLYAMAVTELARAILAARRDATTGADVATDDGPTG